MKDNHDKTAIVIGATGLVGSCLVKLLVKADNIDKIVVIARRPVSYSSAKIQSHVIDFNELVDYECLFKGDLFFSCLGTTLKQVGSRAAQRVIDLDYQYNAAHLAYRQGVNHYLLVSSSGANSESASAYLQMKGELEDKVESLGFNYVSILQPSLLLGEREQPRLVERVAGKVFPLICRIPAFRRYRPIEGKKVAQKMLELSIKPSASVERITLDNVFPHESTT